MIALELAEMVKQCGHDVVAIAHHGASAWSVAAGHAPDLALVDIDLGGEPDGVETAVRLREFFDVRSLFLTARVDPISRDRAQAAWPLGLLRKPFPFEALKAELKAAASALQWSARDTG